MDAASSLPRVDPHRPRGTPRRSRRGPWRAAVLIGVHVLIGLHIAHWLVAGTTLTPLEPSEAGETLTLGYVNAGFLVFALLLLSTLLLGRFFCGWGCHVVALQDLCAWLLGKLGLRPRPIRSRALAWIPLLAAVEMFVLPSVLRMVEGTELAGLQWHLTTDDFWARFPGFWIGALTFAVDGFLVVWLLGAKGFCTYGCPYGALFGMADRYAPGRIRVNDSCEACGHCTAVCTSNVRVHEEVARYGMVVDPGCMKCMDCVSVCPKDALSYSFGGSRRRAVSGKAPRRAGDFSLGEELLLLAVFAGAFYATRNLYGAVPFLLAIGLSTVVALGAVLGGRLLVRRDLSFQHWTLRRAGAFTPAGAAAGLACLVLLGGTAHAGWVQYDTRAGRGALERASALAPGSPDRAAALARSERHLERALRQGWVETAVLHNQLGQIAGARGDAGAARAHFARALELDPELAVPRLQLADLALAERDAEAATRALRGLFERHPLHAALEGRLRRVLGLDLGALDAHVLLAEHLWARGDERDARAGVAWVLERDPGHPRARELAERWGPAPPAEGR